MPNVMIRRKYADAPRLPEADVYDLRQLFESGAAKPVSVDLEIGCARGGFLLERLTLDPAAHVVGFDINLKSATVSAQKIEEHGHIERCRVFAVDAQSILPKLATGSVRRVFMHFPDPWWKRRHTKRRLASAEVLEQIERVLEDGGELFIQTDVGRLAEAFARAAQYARGLRPARGEPRVADNPYGARSPREKQATLDGLPIYRLWYRKQPSPLAAEPRDLNPASRQG